MDHLILEVGTRPLTIEERSHIGTYWKKFSELEKMEVAARIRGVSKSKTNYVELFVEIINIVHELDKKYA